MKEDTDWFVYIMFGLFLLFGLMIGFVLCRIYLVAPLGDSICKETIGEGSIMVSLTTHPLECSKSDNQYSAYGDIKIKVRE